MATNTISQVAPIVNENSPIHVIFLNENTPAVRSDLVATNFGRSHKNVLRDIAKLRPKCPESFYRLNFEPVDYVDHKGEKRPACLLTRDAFSLLVMGFTGAAAVAWKLKYIEAFNALEKSVLEQRTELAHESGFAQGLAEARALPAVQAERQSAYLSGMQEGAKLQKRRDGLTRLIKIREYLHKGLTHREISKILGVTRQAVTDTLRRARAQGLVA